MGSLLVDWMIGWLDDWLVYQEINTVPVLSLSHLFFQSKVFQ